MRSPVAAPWIWRVQLLHEPVTGRVEFVHRTFQEYLAARAAYEANEISELLNHANDDQWRETIILAAGMTNTRQSDRLLSGLLKGTGDPQTMGRRSPEKARLRRTRRLTLAVACLETCVERSPEIAAAVLRAAERLFPPKDEEEAKLLAAAGSPAIPMLRAQPWHSGEEAAACVMSLALIGGDAALDALAGYAEDDSYGVCKALGQAWDSFDRNGFAERVLRGARRLMSSEGFDRLAHLTTLDLSETQVEVLRELPNLATLDLSYTQVSDLEVLRELPNLTKLNLSGREMSDLEALCDLPNLTTLDLSFAQVSGLEALCDLSKLTTLYLYNMYVSDLEAMRDLPSLTTLNLSFTSVSDLEALRDLQNLTTLNLNFTSASNLEALRDLQNLTTLNLYNTQVSDLEALRRLTHLTTLELGNTQVSDLEPLRGLINLTELDISNTNVSDLTPLQSLPNLRRLHIRRTKVRDLSALKDMPNLRVNPPWEE